MLLCVDIGNTNITLGLFKDEEYINEFRLASDKDLSRYEYEVLFDSLLKNYNINKCIIASVVEELNVKIPQALENVLKVKSLFLTNETPCGVKIIANNPSEVGADRIANAAAAWNKYGQKAVIVVDFGTATTFDIVNSNGEFFGGVIAPGIKTQLKCLESATSKLPEIDVSMSPCAIGHDTQEAILSGVIRGSACMVEGLIEQCEKEMGQKTIIVATGGYSPLIANYMKRPFDYVNKILTLEGLKEIYKINQTT